MKKLLNDPAKAVDESVEGFGLAHPNLVRVHTDPLFVTRATKAPPGTVALVSGGGAGPEPLHAGFVGEGMLDAAVRLADGQAMRSLGTNGQAGLHRQAF